MKKCLVAFYSFSGSTLELALEIADQTGGDIRELVPEKTYAFDYNTAAKEIRGEIIRGYCPRLERGNESIDAFDIIFIGSPNWFKSIAPPVLSFLRSHNFTGKIIVPFCTHGGGGMGEIEKKIMGECHGTDIRPGLAMESAIDKALVADWLKEIDLADK